jgi:hypothetical protein
MSDSEIEIPTSSLQFFTTTLASVYGDKADVVKASELTELIQCARKFQVLQRV